MARTAPRILVSIVNWNNSSATNICLASIANIPEGDQPDIVLVDNGSTEEMLIKPEVIKNLQSLRIVKNDRNLGFAAGHNPNIKYAFENQYDYAVLLNNDSEVMDKILFSSLAEAIEKRPKAIGANPTILSSVNPDVVWYGGGRLSLKTGYTSHKLVGQDVSRIPDGDQAVSLLTGGCLAINLKRAELKDLLLPEAYFVYWEDTEWCARMIRLGFELLYVPRVKLLHNVSSSLGVRSPTYIYYNIRNHLLFIRRNIQPLLRPAAWTVLIWIVLKYKLNILLRYRRDRLRSFKAVWVGCLDGLRGRTGSLGKNL